MITPGKNNHHLVMPTRTVSGDEDTTIEFWWRWQGSNLRPDACKAPAHSNWATPPKTTSKFLKNFYYCLGCVVSHWLESKSNLPKEKAPVLRGAFCFSSELWVIYSFSDTPKQKTHTIAPPAGRAGVAAVGVVRVRVSILVSL